MLSTAVGTGWACVVTLSLVLLATCSVCKKPDGSDWLLGTGSFGRVVKGMVNGEEVAMKMTIVNAEAAADQGMADRLAASFMREIALLKVRVQLSAPIQIRVLQCVPAAEEVV